MDKHRQVLHWFSLKEKKQLAPWIHSPSWKTQEMSPLSAPTKNLPPQTTHTSLYYVSIIHEAASIFCLCINISNKWPPIWRKTCSILSKANALASLCMSTGMSSCQPMKNEYTEESAVLGNLGWPTGFIDRLSDCNMWWHVKGARRIHVVTHTWLLLSIPSEALFGSLAVR